MLLHDVSMFQVFHPFISENWAWASAGFEFWMQPFQYFTKIEPDINVEMCLEEKIKKKKKTTNIY